MLEFLQTGALGGYWSDRHGEAIELHPESHHQPAKNKRRPKRKTERFSEKIHYLNTEILQTVITQKCLFQFFFRRSFQRSFLPAFGEETSDRFGVIHAQKKGVGPLQSAVIPSVCLFFCNSGSGSFTQRIVEVRQIYFCVGSM